MHRFVTSGAVLTIIAVLSLSCTLHGGDPVVPEDLTSRQTADLPGSQTHLWGLYDVYIDIPAQTATAELTRSAMFTANVVNFINGNPTGLSFHINGTPAGGDYVDVDIDVSLTHPFPGLTQYNGYDVRGVFMGDGSSSMKYNPDLMRPVSGTDQLMLPDPVDGIGGPDGYTRWFNKDEFFKGGMPLFQYTQGKVATPGYSATATLCPYKYFANNLAKDEDLWTWMIDPGNDNQTGVFSAGQTNSRNYYLRFPNAKGVKFSYAILASWKGEAPADHPANAPEAVAVSVVDNSTVYYVDPSENGGNLVLDVSLWDWDSTVSPTGAMQDYKIYVESSVLSGVYEASTSDMTPIDGGLHYSTYHFDIPADNVTGLDDNEYWVIAECADEDYSNEFGEYNDAWNVPLAAFFRFDLVANDDTPPVITGITDDIPPDGLNTIVNASNTAVTYIALYDDPDVGQDHTFKWYIEDSSAPGPSDPPDSMPYNWGPKAPGDYKIWVKVSDGFAEVTSDAYEITKATPGWQWTRTWGGNNDIGGWGLDGYCVAVDNFGNIYAGGGYYDTVDFDPGDGVDEHTSNGSKDCFISKFNSSGEFQWAKTWGGIQAYSDPNHDCVTAIAVDQSGCLYAAGYFGSFQPVDFDPGDGYDFHSSNGGRHDAFLSKFDSSGNFIWARTWGGNLWDGINGNIAVDSLGNIYTSGAFESMVDFDTGAGSDNHSSNGAADCFLNKFDSSGNFCWARTWGGGAYDRSSGVSVDSSGNVYVTGLFSAIVDFNPGSGIDNHFSFGGYDAFLSKFASTGDFEWAGTWGGSGWDMGINITTDNNGNAYVSGRFDTSVDFDPSADSAIRISNGGADAYLSKLDSNGNLDWVNTWGSTFDDLGMAVAVDSQGSSYVTGRFEGTVDFDPGSGASNVDSNGKFDVYMSKFGQVGDFVNVYTWGSSGGDCGHHIVVDQYGYQYVVGRFEYTVDFDPGDGVDSHTAIGDVDFFLSKFAPE
jgi:hypothetical protein